jgi:D-alanyl-D-alanine carboxypeptidase (penicillin-binding protein 5/6)
LVAGVAAWLAFGDGDIGDSSRLGTLGILTPGAEREPAPPQRPQPTRAEEAALSLGGRDEVRVEFEDPPAAGLLFDLDTGDVLWRRNARAERPVASLTKIMTALLVAEDLRRPRRQVEIGGDAAGLDASGGVLGSAVGLEAGMRVSVGALFHAMLISSANDATTALAIESAGSVERFVESMNRRARRLELDCTHFVSAHGLEPENRSCAADLGALTRLAMAEPLIERVARKPRAVVEFPIAGGKRYLATTNPLLQEGYEGTIGLKTGFTEEAGSSLAAVVRRDGRTLAAVLLDSEDPSGQAEKLFEAAFSDGDGGGREGERRR